MPAKPGPKTIEGDLIAHGCNCQGVMGGGLAKAIRAHFPEAYDADLATKKSDRNKLGTCSFAVREADGRKLVIVNAYTQYDYRGPLPHVDYDAVRRCMAWIKANHAGARIGLPLIGAGLAGGDWTKIAAIVAEELQGEDVTIVKLPGSA